MKKLLLVFLISFLGISGCSLFNNGKSPQTRKELPRALTSKEKQIVNADQSFSYELFRRTVEQDSISNVFISPLSVSMALGMTLNGAADSTKTAMKEVLHLQGMDQQGINESYGSLIKLLSSADPKVEMKLANSIWIRKGFAVQSAFTDTCKKFFKARIESLDFSDPSAVDRINQWVSNNTQGLIDSIIQGQIPGEVVMYLINAIYFKGDWQYQFDENKTTRKDFRTTNGNVKSDMMTQESDLAAYVSDKVKMLDLPYGDSLFTMTLMMPGNEQTSLDKFVAKDLTAQNVHSWISRLSVGKTRVDVPKFELSYDVMMNDILSSMGMQRAFNANKANFSNINPDAQLFISKVKHKTFVLVDEKGTKAAAATSVSVGVTSVGPDIRTIQFNRPFVFMIRERTSGTIFFIGVMKNPKE
ncbi:MAG TPA: serpin family protein [Balneolaceae bacterium]|nr:serpin family protein [Balneolaceae bacterium]